VQQLADNMRAGFGPLPDEAERARVAAAVVGGR